MILIKPDKSYEGALPERYGQEGKSFEEVFEDANISKTGDVSNALTLTTNSHPTFTKMEDGSIQLHSLNEGYQSVKIYSLNGRVIKELTLETGISTDNIVVSSGEFTRGTYIFEATNEDSATRSLIKL